MGLAIRSIYLWFRERSVAGDVAGLSALAALVSFLLIFWVDEGSGVQRGWTPRVTALVAANVLTLTSLVECSIVRARARARRGSRAWISFLPVPFLATPLLFADVITVMELIHGH